MGSPQAENRTGIFFCNCDGKFSDILDFRAIIGGLDLSSGEIVQEVPGLCKEEGQIQLSQSIRAASLNGLVIAGCREDRLNKACLFTAHQHGIGPHRTVFVNVQDLCVNVHNPGGPIDLKAAHLTQQALVGLRLQLPVEDLKLLVFPAVMVIGGGEAASEVAGEVIKQQPVILVDEGAPPQVGLATSYAGCRVTGVGGQAGRFTVTLQGPEEDVQVRVGGIVVALDTPKLIDPSLQLPDSEGIVGVSRFSVDGAEDWHGKTVAFVMGDGESQAFHSTARALELALELREKYGARVEFFFKQMKVAGQDLEYRYRLAREKGVRFNRYHDPLDVHVNVLGVTIQYNDPQLTGNEPSRVLADCLAAGEVNLPAPETARLSEVLQVKLGPGGFFQPDNINLLPSRSNREGVYFVGACHHPVHLLDTALESKAVAAKLARFARGYVNLPQLQAIVDSEKCALCLTCYRTCPHKAVDINHEAESARIDPLACQACGICAAECPAKAIELPRFRNRQLIAQLGCTGKVVAFACENSGVAAAELAGVLNRKYPAEVEVIKVPCAGNVGEDYMLRAFENGAEGVLLLTCHTGNCKSLLGNTRAEARLQRTREALASAGIEPRRVQMQTLASNSAHRFVQSVSGLVESIELMRGEGETR